MSCLRGLKTSYFQYCFRAPTSSYYLIQLNDQNDTNRPKKPKFQQHARKISRDGHDANWVDFLWSCLKNQELLINDTDHLLFEWVNVHSSWSLLCVKLRFVEVKALFLNCWIQGRRCTDHVLSLEACAGGRLGPVVLGWDGRV